MVLFKIKFRELERFPQQEREAIARRCYENPELQRLRKRRSLYAGIVSVASVALVVALGNLVFKWNVVVTAVVAFLFAMFTVTTAIFLKVSAEVRLIRRLLRKELAARAG